MLGALIGSKLGYKTVGSGNEAKFWTEVSIIATRELSSSGREFRRGYLLFTQLVDKT